MARKKKRRHGAGVSRYPTANDQDPALLRLLSESEPPPVPSTPPPVSVFDEPPVVVPVSAVRDIVASSDVSAVTPSVVAPRAGRGRAIRCCALHASRRCRCRRRYRRRCCGARWCAFSPPWCCPSRPTTFRSAMWCCAFSRQCFHRRARAATAATTAAAARTGRAPLFGGCAASTRSRSAAAGTCAATRTGAAARSRAAARARSRAAAAAARSSPARTAA